VTPPVTAEVKVVEEHVNEHTDGTPNAHGKYGNGEGSLSINEESEAEEGVNSSSSGAFVSRQSHRTVLVAAAAAIVATFWM